MFLEEWIGDKIGQPVEQDSEFHQCTAGKRINRQELENFQLIKLKNVLFHVSEKSAFYRGLFHEQGIAAKDVHSLSDLAKIPFTEPVNLSESPYKFLCIPLGEIARVFSHTTSGTTGAPKKVFFTEGDIAAITDCIGAITKTATRCAGLPEKELVIQIFMPNGIPMSQANLIAQGVERMGNLPVAEDLTKDIPELIKAVARTRPDILIGSVFRLHRITQEALLYHDIGEWGVKIILITSEYLSPAMRERLSSSWNAEVYHHYGMTELGLAAAIECEAHQGFHLNEADLLVEVVNPSTGEILGDAEEGELVFTTLSRRGMPLIRYRTGDLATISHQPCDCGSCITRIGQVAKRVDSIVKIGAHQIYPSLFDDVLYIIPSLIDYRVFLTREGNKDLLTLNVELTEEAEGVGEKMIQALLGIPAIKRSVEANSLSILRVEFAKRGALRRVGRVKQRIVDNRSNSETHLV